MKAKTKIEWCEASAKLEGNSEVGAGVLPASPCSAGVWDEMDQFDRAWFCQSVDGTLREDQRGDVEGAIADHERAGNWNVSSTMRKFKFKQNKETTDDATVFIALNALRLKANAKQVKEFQKDFTKLMQKYPDITLCEDIYGDLVVWTRDFPKAHKLER